MAERPRNTTPEGDPEGGVLAGLPATRPNRMGRRGRDGASTKPAARKAVAKAKPKAKARAAKAKAAPKAKAEPRTTAEKATAATANAAAATPKAPTPIAEGRKPRPVRAGHPGLGARDAARKPAADTSDPGVAASVVHAAGELATLGVSLGGHVLKGIGKRIPRP